MKKLTVEARFDSYYKPFFVILGAEPVDGDPDAIHAADYCAKIMQDALNAAITNGSLDHHVLTGRF